MYMVLIPRRASRRRPFWRRAAEPALLQAVLLRSLNSSILLLLHLAIAGILNGGRKRALDVDYGVVLLVWYVDELARHLRAAPHALPQLGVLAAGREQAGAPEPEQAAAFSSMHPDHRSSSNGYRLVWP